MTTRNSQRFSALLCALISSSACGGNESAPAVDLGPRRELVYINGAEPEGLKHGGAHGDVDTVYVFDRQTFDRVAVFSVEGGADDMSATPDGSLVWIVNGEGNTVTLFDTTSYALTTIPVGVSPEHSYITPDHSQIWVGNDASANVSIIDIASRSFVGSVVTGAGHHKIAFAEDDAGGLAFAYVSNIGDSSITPVTQARLALTNVSGVGSSPHGMDYSRATHAVYNCSGDASHSIEVIATRDDPETSENEQHTVVARIPLAERCRYLRVSDDGLFAHATTSDSFVRVDLTSLEVTTFATGRLPDTFEIVENRAYVGNVGDAFVSVIDLEGVASTETITVGSSSDPLEDVTDGAREMRLHGSTLFVSNAFDGTVSVIDVTANTVTRTIEGIPSAGSIAVAGPEGGTTFPR